MSRTSPRNPYQAPDWETIYREGIPAWDTGLPANELVRVVAEGLVRPCTTLELGCGTGANAVHLARRGFEVTAIDSSPTALERARTRAERCGAVLRFVLDDVYSFGQTSGSFDFVVDAGFYHFARRVNLSRFLDLLWRITSPGSLYLALAGATGEPAEGGPPQVSEEEIRLELGRLFECVDLRPFRFESPTWKDGYLGWSCLMRRPLVRVTEPTGGSSG